MSPSSVSVLQLNNKMKSYQTNFQPAIVPSCLPIIGNCPPGRENLHQLHLHRHADGEEHLDGVRLPEDQGVLQGEARPGVPGGGHEVGGEGRDD